MIKDLFEYRRSKDLSAEDKQGVTDEIEFWESQLEGLYDQRDELQDRLADNTTNVAVMGDLQRELSAILSLLYPSLQDAMTSCTRSQGDKHVNA